MSMTSWRESIKSPRFELLHLWTVAFSGGLICLFPDFWLWFLIIALIPLGFRVIAGVIPIQQNGLGGLLAVFVITAGVGCWAAYDRPMALTKLALILVSVLLFFALKGQPEENLIWVTYAMFFLALGTSVYFLLTHDFIENPRRLEFVNSIGRWIMQIRPPVSWAPIHQNYAAGIAAMFSPFIFYPLFRTRSGAGRSLSMLIAVMGLGIVLFAIVMATSRGVALAVTSAAGAWLILRLVQGIRINPRRRHDAMLPSLVLLFLSLVVLLLYMGPAGLGSGTVTSSYYGDGSRAEVFKRSVYLVTDFPFTGGGLGAYPGLYSQYILNIPFYYLPNAHNMFLDVFIEQGIPGGFVFLSLYVVSLWRTAGYVTKMESVAQRLFAWLALSCLVMAFVQGMVDNYLYNGRGTILSLVPLGVAAIPMQSAATVEQQLKSSKTLVPFSLGLLLMTIFLLNMRQIRSAWVANIGAVRMAHVELADFPANEWAGSEMAPFLDVAGSSLRSSLEADPANRTANHRLGLISLYDGDFSSAAEYLETAHSHSPHHRGIVKALGYCYVWLGEYAHAQVLLDEIPEAMSELDSYTWWWKLKGRSDLSAHASFMRKFLKSRAPQP